MNMMISYQELVRTFPKKIYLFNRQLNQPQGLGIYMDIFILKCDMKDQQCHSYYYKEIKNA